MSARVTGLALAITSAVAFGGAGVAAKPLIDSGVDPLHVVWLRVTGAALVLLPLAWKYRAVAARNPGHLLGFSLLAVVGVQAFYFSALSYIPVGVALLIEYMAPALVLFWIRFIQRRRVSRAAAVGAVLAILGLTCVVQVWTGLGFNIVGLCLAFGAACCQAGFFLLSGKGSEKEDPIPPVAVISHGVLLGAIVLTVLTRPWNLEWSHLSGPAELSGVEVSRILLVAWIILVSTVAAYLTGVIAIRRLSPQVAGVVACLEAVVAALLAWLLLSENMTLVQVLGAVFILLGAFIAQRSSPTLVQTDDITAEYPLKNQASAPLMSDEKNDYSD